MDASSPDAAREGGSLPDGAIEAGHFVDAQSGDGSIGETGSIGGGGCACSAVGDARTRGDGAPWAGGGLSLLVAVGAWARRKKERQARAKHEPGRAPLQAS
jgi:hypothetical protein